MKYVLPIVACFALYGQTPQFEVASIRPSAPLGGDHVDIGVHVDGAQLRCTQLSLKDYVRAAFQVKIYQVSGPDWLGSERFDIAAKIAPGTKEDQIPELIEALLTDRFEMKTHREKKDFPVYGLVVGKGGLKLKETPKDPSAPPDKEAPKAAVNVSGSGGRGGVHINLGNGSFYSLADNKFVARKLSMATFAEVLARFEDRPVVDMTGLTGDYDLDLEFTPEDYMALLIRSAIAAGVTMPPEALKVLEHSSGDSMLMALEKVGLKLEPRKAPLDVIVVDHMSKAPTEN